MEAVIKKWGNSYAVRLTQADLRGLGLRPGQRVHVDIRAGRAPVDLSDLPTVLDDLPFDEVRRQHYRSMPERDRA